MRHIAIASDHAGFRLKERLKQELQALGYQVTDFGTDSPESMDYPDTVHPLAREVNDGKMKQGIVICGTGNGVAMTANKYPNVRAGLAWKRELAELTRKHNDANILALPARFISEDEAIACMKAFLTTGFEGGRHARRVKKIPIPCE